MKKTLLGLTFLFTLILLIGCAFGKPKASLTLDAEEVDIYVGDTYEIEAILTNSSNTINYKVNDEIYSITIMDDIVRLIKKDKEKSFELIFDKNKKTEGKLTIFSSNLYMNLTIDTLNLEINEYNIKINYKLYIENEFSNNVLYKLDWREI